MNGNELRQRRQNLGLSRREFAQKMPFSEKTLQNLENQEAENIPEKYLSAINDVLNTANKLNEQVEKHLKTGSNGTSIEFKIKESAEADNKTISSIASKGTSEADQKRVISDTIAYLGRFLTKLPQDVIINIYALYVLIRDGDIKLYDKFVAFGALLYFISPIDAIPDVTPIVGFIDDIGVIALAIYAYDSSPQFEKSKTQAEKELKEKGWID